MFQLHIANQIFAQPIDFEGDFSGFSEMEKAALDFCKAWLSGQKNFIQQTSGSTGIPKKIELTREQMQASAAATGDFFQTHTESRLLCCLSPEYIAGKMMLVRAMVWDCPIWLVEPSGNPLEGLDFIPDFVAMVPLQVEKSMKSPKSLEVLQQVENLIIGGAPISETLKKQLLKNQIRAWQTYGMTETVSHVALAKITDESLVYQTLPGVEIGQDEREALWVKSPMSGAHPIQTNDLVELISRTSFRWLGRADFVVNSGGIKLHPELLEGKAEAAVQALFPGSRFFFIGEKDEKLGERLVLVLESPENKEKSAALLKQLEAVLGKYEVPKKILFRLAFAETASGKVNRRLSFEGL
ncbi:AMP-binding protein [Algoriphagus sp. H41]|uniref:AMP-binding protein n=1 Tax=Algoriphagus oliviformis TaxID=2811231 RepID=A0ABS3C6J2_9BACT|nr:AMP-binding protein [Algoriphagus oliviformis]MBN7812738.1 AMP-binding protein [Algoriphagus oliviformis]